jgi:hypothetical protein
MPETKLAQADTPTNNDTICCALPCLAVHSAIPPPHKTFMRCCTENHSGWPSLQGHRQNEMTEHVTERICWRSGCKRRNAVHAGGGVAPTKETSVFRSTFSVPDFATLFSFSGGSAFDTAPARCQRRGPAPAMHKHWARTRKGGTAEAVRPSVPSRTASLEAPAVRLAGRQIYTSRLCGLNNIKLRFCVQVWYMPLPKLKWRSRPRQRQPARY